MMNLSLMLDQNLNVKDVGFSKKYSFTSIKYIIEVNVFLCLRQTINENESIITLCTIDVKHNDLKDNTIKHRRRRYWEYCLYMC